MVIAIDIRGKEAYRNFIFVVFKILTEQKPGHTFLFISDQPGELFSSSKNVITVIIKSTKISLLNDNKISSLLKKYKAGVLVTSKYISQIKAPQCLIAMDDVISGSLKNAKVIVTVSRFSKTEIIEKYKIAHNKIDVVYIGVDDTFNPVSFIERERIKEQYSGGNEYFLFSGEINSQNNLLNLLKAFSSFKKMLKSNMQLLIAPGKELSQEFLEKLRTFKYKNEVKVLQDITEEDLATITGAAYAFVYPFSNYVYPVTAMRSGVPVIVSNAGALPEICSDAALYINSEDHKDIADKMMLIFKDEKVRSKLIEKGNGHVKQYSWEKTAAQFWNSIAKVAN